MPIRAVANLDYLTVDPGVSANFSAKIDTVQVVIGLKLPLDLAELEHNKKAVKSALEAQIRDFLISQNVATFADDDSVELIGF